MKKSLYLILYFKKIFLIFFSTSCLRVDTDFNFEQISSINGLDCRNIKIKGTLIAGEEALSIPVSIPYNLGNGLPHSGFSINSIGIEGLKLELPAGNFSEKADSLVCKVVGKPNKAGIAIFPVVIGRDSCLLELKVISKLAMVGSLLCNEVIHSGQLTAFTPAEGLLTNIPYTDGNGANFPSITIPSFGVVGLEAKLEAGTLNVGNGNLIFSISGVTQNTGVAVFDLKFASKECKVTRTVNLPPPNVKGLNCTAFKLNKPLYKNNDIPQGAQLEIPYVGGNSGLYNSQTIISDKISGVTAFLPAGSLLIGNGSLIYNLSGKPNNVGFASFNLVLGDNSCIVNIPVNEVPNESCGAFIRPGVWKVFKCHNLGADETADPFTPSWRIIGDYYKWGRKYWEAKGPEGPDSANANASTPLEWSNTIASRNAWQNNNKSFNDPCPDGYLVPTKEIWEGVIQHNIIRFIGGGNWFSWIIDYRSGIKIGEKLFLPAAGGRDWDGTRGNRGAFGSYWSSTWNDPDIGPNAYAFWWSQDLPYLRRVTIGYAYPVRCMAE